jgi:hypothetical protein
MTRPLVVVAVLLAAICSASAQGTSQAAGGTPTGVSARHSVDQVQTANRKGSKRVGGKNSKGKGGKYVGGRPGKK